MWHFWYKVRQIILLLSPNLSPRVTVPNVFVTFSNRILLSPPIYLQAFSEKRNNLMTKFQKKRNCWILSSTTARAGANSKWWCEYLRDVRGVFHSHPYHIIFSQQSISRYMVVYLSSKARRGTGRLVNKFSTGDHGGHEEGAGVGGRVGQDRSHSFLRPLHTALFISSAGFSSQELGSNLQSHTDSTWWTMLNSSIKEKIPL